MAYIDKEKAQIFLGTDCLERYPASFANGLLVASYQISKLPAADVVPKSEVEKIFEEIDRKIISDIDLCNGLLVEFDSAEEISQRIKGEVSALLQMQDFIDYIKTKYKEGKK